ncbi:MAG: hypothetical protein QXU17_00260 [Archaeoglobaceae archaeon]
MKRTGLFIRRFLLKYGEAYVHEMWKAYCRHCKDYGYSSPSRQSFGNYVWMLKKLGLIRFLRSEVGQKGAMRHYYALNRKRIYDAAWRDPVKALGFRSRAGKKARKR